MTLVHTHLRLHNSTTRSDVELHKTSVPSSVSQHKYISHTTWESCCVSSQSERYGTMLRKYDQGKFKLLTGELQYNS